MRWSLAWTYIAVTLSAAGRPPQFPDFAVFTPWTGQHAVPQLTRPDERMFCTRLTQDAKESSNFAGHYRFVGWGCGSVFVAGMSGHRPS